MTPVVVGGGGQVDGTQRLLPTVHLAEQGVLHPVDEHRLLGEVRDHRRSVWQPFQAREGGTSLEVDEYEVQFPGAVVVGETGDHGLEQLGFTGPGRTDAQSVRSDASLGGLPDVEVHRRLPGPADRGAQVTAGEVQQRRVTAPGAPGTAEGGELDVAEPVGGGERPPAVDGPGGEDLTVGVEQQATGPGGLLGVLVGVGDDGAVRVGGGGRSCRPCADRHRSGN